jgi:hypothetical protein
MVRHIGRNSSNHAPIYDLFFFDNAVIRGGALSFWHHSKAFSLDRPIETKAVLLERKNNKNGGITLERFDGEKSFLRVFFASLFLFYDFPSHRSRV